MGLENDPMFTGVVPWAAEDFMATVEEARRLRETPHDDWDRTQRGFSVREAGGPVIQWIAKPDIIDYQLVGFLAKRHADRRDDVPCHMFRFRVMNEFLGANIANLVRDGLGTPTDGGGFQIRTELLDVLARARYEDRTIDEYGHEQCTFNYLEVVPTAQKLIAEENPPADTDRT